MLEQLALIWVVMSQLSTIVDIDTVGLSVTYTGTDPSGNTATATRTVNVVDTTAPVLTVTGDNPATTELGAAYTDAGATGTDLGGDVLVTSTSTVDIDTVGSYTVTILVLIHQEILQQQQELLML